MSEAKPMPLCPMADTCKRMMGRPHFGMPLMIAGAVLIVMGIAIVVEPRLSPWLVALLFVAMGAGMLLMAMFMRKMTARFLAGDTSAI